jgi:hypothetical protein
MPIEMPTIAILEALFRSFVRLPRDESRRVTWVCKRVRHLKEHKKPADDESQAKFRNIVSAWHLEFLSRMILAPMVR